MSVPHKPIEVTMTLAQIAEIVQPKPGTHEALAAGLDAYHAVNLLEALKLVPDTGDWHGSLRIACRMALEREAVKNGPDILPNQTAEQMADAAVGLMIERTSAVCASSPKSESDSPGA